MRTIELRRSRASVHAFCGFPPTFGVETSPGPGERPAVPRRDPEPFPPLLPERLVQRVAEAMQVALKPTSAQVHPNWVVRVLGILKEQFIPREYWSVLSADGSAFVEGIGVAWTVTARDLARIAGGAGTDLAAELADRADLPAGEAEVARQVSAGTLTNSADFQGRVLQRLLATSVSERRAFAEGLVLGYRLPELLDQQARSRTTDATNLYLLLWLYWPEVAQLKSIGEVAKALKPFFGGQKNLTGANWEERIRKLANRIGLSFRAKQSDAPAVQPPRRAGRKTRA